MKQMKNGATAPNGSGLPKKGLSPDQIFSRSLKIIGTAKTIDDLVLAAYVASGCADALLLSALIDLDEYHRQNKEIIHAVECVQEILEAADDKSH